MSYVLGWKTRSNVYLAADSMITGTQPSVDSYSSFGERQICNSGIAVAERGMKLIVDEDLAVGLCGDFTQARELASCLFRAYRRSHDLEPALRDMVVSNGPFPMKHTAQLVIAWQGEPSPRLFSFNHDRCGTVRELGEGEGVPLGSISGMHKGMTQALFKPLFEVERQGPQAYLAAGLGVLQSFGVHDYLVEDGVGGSFTGLCVGRAGIKWQPDLLYVIDEPDRNIWSAVATCVRDGNMIVNSTMTNAAHVFMTDVDNTKDSVQWLKEWGPFAESFITRKQFDFVILLGLRHHVVIVIEMRRVLESRMLSFHADRAVDNDVTWFDLHTKLLSALRRGFSNPEKADTRDFRFGFEPYQPRPRGSED